MIKRLLLFRTRILFENEIGTVSCLPRKARREINILNFLTKTKQLSIAYKLMKSVHKPTSVPTDDFLLTIVLSECLLVTQHFTFEASLSGVKRGAQRAQY